MGSETRRCPRSHPDAPHDMVHEGGRWVCPIERDAKLAEEWRVRQAEVDMLEGWLADA